MASRSAATSSSGSSTRAAASTSGSPRDSSSLAHGAEPRSPAADPRLLERCAAAKARLALAPVHLELRLHPPGRAIRPPVVAQRRPLSANAGLERLPDAAMQGAHLRLVELARRPARIDLRPPERLVRVDVPEPGERALVEQGRLDRRAAPREPRCQRLRRERALERFAAQPGGEVRVELVVAKHEPRAEPADVAIRDVRSVV